VCVCGSTKHRAEIFGAVRSETLLGRIALAPGVFSHADGSTSILRSSQLTELHEHKIRLADEILIVDVDGCVGDATAREAGLAASLGKPVRSRTHAACLWVAQRFDERALTETLAHY